jgi:pyruvate/2-oxoglutarate dehydrogenase complex dihydrolipoamide dehydrogenase (E3) component
VRDLAAEFARTESAEALRSQGIDVIHGSASFEAYDSMRIDGSTPIASKRFVIATGSRPMAPDIPGLAEAGFLDDHSVWTLTKLPESLIVIGVVPSALEFAQCFARFGVRVTLLSSAPRILPGDDPEAADVVARNLNAEGVSIKQGVVIKEIGSRADQKVCEFQEWSNGAAGEVSAAAILVAGGRLANVDTLNLQAVEVHGDPKHGIEVDECLQTASTRVFALGDVLLRHQSVHAAEREASVVFQNAVLKRRKKIDYANLPSATFVDPEIAAVGLSEAQVREQQLPHYVYRVDFSQIGRARIDDRTDGFAKVIATPSGKILGATVVGEEASLIIQEFVLARERGLSLGDIAAATPVYPTYAEVAQHLANQHRSNRLGSGYIQTALKFFYGFSPRVATGNGDAKAERPSPAEHDHTTVAHSPSH